MFEIGTTLRQARERRQLGLDRCEAETKIRARYLRALEDEDFDVLPGPTFVRGFLRSYASHLGLDGQDDRAELSFEPPRRGVRPARSRDACVGWEELQAPARPTGDVPFRREVIQLA